MTDRRTFLTGLSASCGVAVIADSATARSTDKLSSEEFSVEYGYVRNVIKKAKSDIRNVKQRHPNNRAPHQSRNIQQLKAQREVNNSEQLLSSDNYISSLVRAQKARIYAIKVDGWDRATQNNLTQTEAQSQLQQSQKEVEDAMKDITIKHNISRDNLLAYSQTERSLASAAGHLESAGENILAIESRPSEYVLATKLARAAGAAGNIQDAYHFKRANNITASDNGLSPKRWYSTISRFKEQQMSEAAKELQTEPQVSTTNEMSKSFTNILYQRASRYSKRAQTRRELGLSTVAMVDMAHAGAIYYGLTECEEFSNPWTTEPLSVSVANERKKKFVSTFESQAASKESIGEEIILRRAKSIAGDADQYLTSAANNSEESETSRISAAQFRLAEAIAQQSTELGAQVSP